jgi:hypothetical protein
VFEGAVHTLSQVRPGTLLQMNESLKCSKCGGEMQEGFIPDEDLTKRWVAQWVAGKPEPGLGGYPKVSGKQHYFIQSFRCSQCGHLEFYALGT